MKTALITGITGQDGTYLAQYLIKQGYKVYGLIRGQNNPKLEFTKRLIPELEFVEGDLLDQSSLIAAIEKTKPDEVYNLGAISFVGLSWSQPVLTGEITGLGVVRMLEAIRMVKPDARFYQASSSEMFGKVRETPQTEATPFHPRSPYGVAKAYGHYITQNYRESHNMYAVSGILFNHESPRRGVEFVTRKITNAAARIKLGMQEGLVMGNIQAKRDWGYAGDYVIAMHKMLQQESIDDIMHPIMDFVISTGETHTVEEVLEIAFNFHGLDWHKWVSIDKSFIRPAEVDLLQGDSSNANYSLGWQPRVSFKQLIESMCEADLRIVKGEDAVSVYNSSDIL